MTRDLETAVHTYRLPPLSCLSSREDCETARTLAVELIESLPDFVPLQPLYAYLDAVNARRTPPTTL